MTTTSSSKKLVPAYLKQFSRDLKRTKVLQGSHTPADWLKRLRYVAELDSKGDSMRNWMVGGMIAFGLGAFASLFLQKMIITQILLVPLVICFLLFFILKSQDIPNRLRDSVLPLLTLLQQDAEANAPLTLNVDLSGPQSSRKLTQQQTISSIFPRIVETWFVDPWFQGSATLRDGSVLQWEVTDRVRRRKITKRNYRGKIKTKTKYKIKTRMDFTLSVKKNRYQLTPQATSLCGKESEKKWQLKSRRDAESYEPGGQMALPEFLTGISILFNSLKPVE